jgi:hypothetical protein
MARSAEFKTPLCRFSFVQNMFVPTKTPDRKTGTSVDQWQCTLIFPKTADRTPFDAALKSAIVEEWGEGGMTRAKQGLLKLPYLAGDGPEAHSKKTGQLHGGMGPDVWFLRVSSRREPIVRYRSPSIPATADEIKSGDYGFAVLQAFTWPGASGGGVSFGIQYLQKTRDGEPLGGGSVNVDDYFEKIEDTGEAPAATKSGNGAGGLFG